MPSPKTPTRFHNFHNRCTQNRWPPINALIVTSQTRLPGPGQPVSPLTEESFATLRQSIYSYQW